MNKFFTLILFLSFAGISYAQTIIKLEKENGVYYVPCKVNDLKLKFIFDTGAGDVTISLTEAKFMLKNGYLNNDDILENEKYEIANGDIVEGTKIILRKIQIGNLLLENVEASVVHTSTAPLLLGQSALEKLGDIKIDYQNLQLIINSEKNNIVPVDDLPINLDDGFIEVEELISKISNDSLKILIDKGEKGDTVAQIFLAQLYYSGIRINEDNENAFYWFNKASELNCKESYFYLGEIYDNGYGVSQDYKKARYYFEKAANLENIYAMNYLGYYYVNGLGVTEDYIKGKYWYEKASSLGNVLSMSNLGELYEKGFGVTKDYTKAKIWYEKAANLGSADAMYNLGLLYKKREECINAVKWLENAASAGILDAFRDLGDIYGAPYERSVEKEECEKIKDNNKAISYYEKAIQNNDLVSLYKIGTIYYLYNDYEKCKYYYNKAIEKNNTDAMVALGNMYVRGVGVEKDYYKAKELYDKAKNLGHNGYIFYTLLEMINPIKINGISLERREEMAKDYSNNDYLNGWIYLTETKNEIKLFKEVSKDGNNLKVWIKSIPKNNQFTSYRIENAALFKSTTTKQKIATQLNSFKSLCIINCTENKLGEKSSIYYAKDGSIIYSDNNELFNEYDMSEVIPETIGEVILKTICEYYEKYGK